MTNYTIEQEVRRWLRSKGLEATASDYHCPYDALVSGQRIEIKASKFNGAHWQFNIHRHNKVDETQVDFYVLRLEGIENIPLLEFKNAIHLILPAPVNTPTITISPRSLMTRWAKYYDRTDLIQQATLT